MRFRIPKGHDVVSKTVRLPEKLAEEMAIVAQRNKISFNKLAVQCFIYAMERLDESKETEKEDE